MHKTVLAALVLLAVSMAGCNGDGQEFADSIDFITPGTWHINAATDYMLVWVHNPTDKVQEGAFLIRFKDGTRAPSDWQFVVGGSIADPGIDDRVYPDGASVPGQDQREYLNWTWHILALRIPEGSYTGSYDMELVFGPFTKDVKLVVAADYVETAGPGATVTVQYKGTLDDGSEFDAGTLTDVQVGGNGLIPGFSFGMLGTAVGEPVKLRIPPPLAYGYGTGHFLAGETLTFDITLLTIDQ